MPQHRITTPLHRSTPSWIRERDGRLRTAEQARAADSDPIPRNPDLPKLLRAAADELDRWRLLEAAKVIGGKVIG